MKTDYVEIAGTEKQIQKFDRKITYGNSFFSRKELGHKVDKMFADVRNTLSLGNFNIEKLQKNLKIKLYDSEQDIYNRFRMTVPACYTFYNRTVHVSVFDIKNKILSHEFGHVLFDEYLGKRAIGKLGEIVAKYIERVVK